MLKLGRWHGLAGVIELELSDKKMKKYEEKLTRSRSPNGLVD